MRGCSGSGIFPEEMLCENEVLLGKGNFAGWVKIVSTSLLPAHPSQGAHPAHSHSDASGRICRTCHMELYHGTWGMLQIIGTGSLQYSLHARY